MTEVALRVVAEAQDRASGVLKSFRGETDRTTESLRKMQKEARTNAEVEGIFIRGKEQKLTALANARRETVTAARAEQAANAGAVGSFGKFKGAVDGAARGTELLNKAMGVVGFVGVAGAAVAGIVSLIGNIQTYKDVLEPLKATQERFNQLLAEMKGKGRDFEIGKMTEGAASVAKAADEVKTLTANYLESYQLREERESVILNLQERIRVATEKLNWEREHGTASFNDEIQYGGMILAMQQEITPLAAQVAEARSAEVGFLELIHSKQVEANVQIQLAKSYAGGIAAYFEGAGTAIDKMAAKLAGIDVKLPFSGPTSDEERKRLEAEKKKADAERDAAGKRGASMASARREREQSLADQLAQARVAFEVDSEYERKLANVTLDRGIIERDYRAKKLSDTERQLKLQMLDLELMTAIREENERVAETDAKGREDAEQTAQKRIAERRKQSEEKLKESKEARTKDLDARALAIENLGETAARADGPLAALSDRLAGLGSTIQQTAGIWASYTRGQTALGDAIAGTIGTIGSQVAQAISDRRAQALVEGGFETAASIASFASGNIPAGIGHAAAAASFFALAAQGGGKGAASGGGGKGAGAAPSNVIQGNFGQSSRSSRPEDTRTVIVHHYGQGIIYGQGSDVARAGRNADRSLAGTGMQNTGY